MAPPGVSTGAAGQPLLTVLVNLRFPGITRPLMSSEPEPPPPKARTARGRRGPFAAVDLSQGESGPRSAGA
jgi:hypothetical protein